MLRRMPAKVWFITGSSNGFGRIWAEAAVGKGATFHFTLQAVRQAGDAAT